MNYQDAVAYLLEIPKFSKKTSLENLRAILKRLGNPEKKMKIIHVAGTNGKGSVCAFINGMLTGNGVRTGMFTSPHLVRINERLRINGQMISEEDFLDIFHEVLHLVEEMQKEGYVHPSFFEFLFLMAVVYFSNQKVEYGIFETGLGGKLDATNVVEQPVLTIITSISLDHTEILGNTIEEIAGEKAGILKPGVPLVYYDGGEGARVIKETAERMQLPCFPVGDKEIKINKISQKQVDFSLYNEYYRYDHVKIMIPAPYQAVNASLALVAYERLRETEPAWKRDAAALLMPIVWEGRMEEVRKGTFLDGAHNVAGIRAFIDVVKQRECSGKRMLIFSAVVEKDYEQMIELLTEDFLWDRIYVVQLENKRAIKKEELEGLFRKDTDTEIICTDSVTAAYEKATAQKTEKDLLYIAGSLYLVGELKEYLEVKND